MDRGFVKLWRRSIDSAVFADPILWKLWCMCLMKANYKISYIPIEGIAEPVKVMPGQFITGRFALHKEFYPQKKKNQQSPSTIWNKLQTLQNMQNLNIRSHAKFSIITISNWSEYQQNEQPANNRLTTGEQPANTEKKDKKDKNKTYTSDFELFYKTYPNKKAKANAFKAWKKMNGERPNIEKLLGIIEKQKQSKEWKKDGGQFIPHPTTWLNGKRWEDEISKTSQDDEPSYW